MRNKTFLLFIFILTIHATGIAQQDKIADSLLNVLKTQKEDTNRVNTLNGLGNRFRDKRQYELSNKYAKDAMLLAEKLNFKKGLINAYTNLGVNNYYFSNYKEAIEYYRTAIKLGEETGDKSAVGVAYIGIGAVYKVKDKPTEALVYYLTRMKLSEESGDKHTQAKAYYNIGQAYSILGNYPEAIKNLLASLKISEEIGDKAYSGRTYNNIGLIDLKQGNYPEAKKNFLAGLKLLKEINHVRDVTICYNNLGIIYQIEGNYTEAMKNHLAALKISEEIKFKSGSALSYLEIGRTYFFQNNYHDALKNYQASLKLSKESEEKEVIAETYINIGETYFKLNEFPEARQYFNDALYVARHMQSNELLAELTADIKQGQLVLFNKEKAIQTLELNKQKSQKNYLLAGIVLLGILSFFVYKNYRTRQKLKLQTLRNKIASDLHDDVGSTLSSISIFSQMAQEQSKEVNPLLETIGESSRKMLDAMADIVWTINPENDQFEKIILRMRSFAFELLGAKKIDFEFVADDYVTKINVPMEVRKNLYLIFKEATNNMIKYAAANRASFSIKGEKNNLIMLIKDNGKGFDTSQASEGNGLKNMKKRAAEIGGQLVIESGPGNGTEIQLRVAV